MALLDFMKQGTQWLTDNTGMDWNKVQSDPGLAAKRLMGAPVDLNSQYQAQPTQANLLDAQHQTKANCRRTCRMAKQSNKSNEPEYNDTELEIMYLIWASKR